VVEPTAAEAGGKAPQGDIGDEIAASAAEPPQAPGDRDGREHGQDVHQPVDVDEQRAYVERA
jgi:hypothetical protein